MSHYGSPWAYVPPTPHHTLKQREEIELTKQMIRDQQNQAKAFADCAKMRAGAEIQLKSFQTGLAQAQERFQMLQQRQMTSPTPHMYNKELNKLVEKINSMNLYII